MTEAHVVVVGAGVAGLTTALVLSRDSRCKITVAAKHMPGDYDIEYASPWAGANYLPVSLAGTPDAEKDRDTWPELAHLASTRPESGVHFQSTNIYVREKDADKTTGKWFAELLKPQPWFKDLLPNFKTISGDHLPPKYDRGISFTSVCINTALYLPWLASQCLANGVILRRENFGHISEAALAHHTGERADVIVNCTGLSAMKLGGVKDDKMYPARGQIVLVRNEAGMMYSDSGTDDGEEEACYVMQRAAGGGTLLGGSYQRHSWDSQVDPNLANRIMKRAVEICPKLTDGKGFEHLSIIRHGVGLRPVRDGGVRLEKEKIDGVWTIHNYGHGGYGYQSSYGCSQAVAKLVGEALNLCLKGQ